MDEQTQHELARRASPYGLAIVPERHRTDHADPQDERAIQHQWQRLCEEHGAAILGIRDVPTDRVYARLDGIMWALEPLDTAERMVPDDVFNRWRALEAADVPFDYWLWGEEQPEPPQRPNFRPMSAANAVTWNQPLTRPRDPLVIGVIRTAPQRGLWVLVGKWDH